MFGFANALANANARTQCIQVVDPNKILYNIASDVDYRGIEKHAHIIVTNVRFRICVS